MSPSKQAHISGAIEEHRDEPPFSQAPERGRSPNKPAPAKRPTLITPQERPPAIGTKIDALIGVHTCLLRGLRHKYTLNTAHWLRRDLALYYPQVVSTMMPRYSCLHTLLIRAQFNRLQDKIGAILQLHDGRIVRSLALESTDNQDICECISTLLSTNSLLSHSKQRSSCLTQRICPR